MTDDPELEVKVLGMLDRFEELRDELIAKNINIDIMDHRRSIIQKMSLDSQLAQLQSLIEKMQKLAGNSAPPQIKPKHSPTLGDGGCRGPCRHSRSRTTADTPEASDSLGIRGARKRRRIEDSTLVCARRNINEATLRPIAKFVESSVNFMIAEFDRGRDVNYIKAKELLERFGAAVPNVFGNKYTQMSHLREAALCADPAMAIGRIGEARVSFCAVPVNEILKGWPNLQAAVAFCVEAVMSKPDISVPELQLTWAADPTQTEPKNLKYFFKDGILSLKKIKAYADAEPKDASDVEDESGSAASGTACPAGRHPVNAGRGAVGVGSASGDGGGGDEDSAGADAPAPANPAGASAAVGGNSIDQVAGVGSDSPSAASARPPAQCHLAGGGGDSDNHSGGGGGGSEQGNEAMPVELVVGTDLSDAHSGGGPSLPDGGGGAPAGGMSISSAGQAGPAQHASTTAGAADGSAGGSCGGGGDGKSTEPEHGDRQRDAAAAAAVPAAADSAGASAEIGLESLDLQPAVTDGFGYVLLLIQNSAGQTELLGGKCRASLDAVPYHLKVHWRLSPVPDHGSCLLDAVLRAVASLDVEALKRDLPDLNWEVLEPKLAAWAALGNNGDSKCTAFREYTCLLMLDNQAEIEKHLDRDPNLIQNGDITRQNFTKATESLKALLKGPKNKTTIPLTIPAWSRMTRVQKWAVAVLCSSTQMSEEIMRALLAVDLRNWLGILVATSTSDGVIRLLHIQPMTSSENRVLIAVFHESKEQHLEDAVVNDAIAGKPRACKAKNAQGPLSPRAAAAAQSREQARAQKRAANFNRAVFQNVYNSHHFWEVKILNGVGCALTVRGKSGPVADDDGDGGGGNTGDGGGGNTGDGGGGNTGDGGGGDKGDGGGGDKGDGNTVLGTLSSSTGLAQHVPMTSETSSEWPQGKKVLGSAVDREDSGDQILEDAEEIESRSIMGEAEAEAIIDENSREMLADPLFFRRNPGPPPEGTSTVGGTKVSNASGDSVQDSKCTLLRPLALTPSNSRLKSIGGARLSIMDFIILDLTARFSGLLHFAVAGQPLGVGTRIDAKQAEETVNRADSFMLSVHAATTKANPACFDISTPRPLVDQDQLDSLLPGRVAAQELGDRVLQFFCGLTGLDFWNSDSSVIPGGDQWPALKANSTTRFLVVSTKQAGSLSQFVEKGDSEGLDRLTTQASQILRQYTSSIWAFSDGEHCTAVNMKLDQSNQSELRCTMMDLMSATRDTDIRRLPSHLIQGFRSVSAKLHATLVVEESSREPADKLPACVVDMILCQAATITGIRLPADGPGQMYTALLRVHAFMMVHQNLRDCENTPVDVDSIFKKWQEEQQQQRVSALPVALPALRQVEEAAQLKSRNDSESQIEEETNAGLNASHYWLHAGPAVISDETLRPTVKAFVQLAMECPWDKTVFKIVVANTDRKSANALCLFRHQCHPRFVKINACAESRMRSLLNKNAPKLQELLAVCLMYIESILIASCLTENQQYCRSLMRWTKNTLVPTSTALLDRANPVLKSIMLPILGTVDMISCNRDVGAGEGSGIEDGAGLAAASCSDVQIVAVVPNFAHFRNVKGRCSRCGDISAHTNHLACFTCQETICKSCFGAAANAGKSLKYVCSWCLLDYHTRNPGRASSLLVPSKQRTTCFLCKCALNDSRWCSHAGTCRLCRRPYCDRCAGLAHVDSNKKEKCEVIGQLRFAKIDCIFCVGPDRYSKDRRQQLTTLVREVFSKPDLSDLQSGRGIMRSDLQSHAQEANAFGNMMAALFWMGLRDLFEEFLPILMQMVLVQTGITLLSLSVSPLDMGYYLRKSKPGQTTLAGTVMLEKVCRSHAESAMRKGRAMLAESPTQLRQARSPGQPAVVVFYAPDLFTQSPTCNLVWDAIVRVSDSDNFIVYGCGFGPVDQNYPPAKGLADFLDTNTRKVLLNKNPKMLEVLAEFRRLKPDIVVTFAGWAEGDLAEVLWVLAQEGVTILSTLGPNLMHFPEAITFTLVGAAVAEWQLNSPSRERLAIFATPDTYQPAQVHRQVGTGGWEVQTRADFHLPSGFILMNTASQNWLGCLGSASDSTSLIHLYCDLLSRPGFEHDYALLPDRPDTMRFHVWNEIDTYVQAKGCGSNLRDRFLFRNFSAGTGDYYALMYAVANEGEGGAAVGSFCSVEPHSCTQDALNAMLLVFVTEDKKGLMGSRVASEVVIAAGFGALCVGENDKETLDKVAVYKHSPELRMRAREHLRSTIRGQLGLFSSQRIPNAWKAVINHSLALRDEGGIRADLLDFQIPSDRSPAPVFVVDRIAASVDAIIGQLQGTEPEMAEVTRCSLMELASKYQVEFLRVEGSGSFVNTVCCRLGDGRLCALKMDKRSRHYTSIHNSPVMREGSIIDRAAVKLRNHPWRGMIPEPISLLDGRSFMFATNADSRGRVVPCLLCEFIQDDCSDVLAQQKANWQERGVFDESFRLDFLCPMFLSMYYLQENAFFNLDIKPGNFRRRNDGQLVYIDFGLGHCFSSARTGSTKTTAAQETCLLSRKLTSVIEQERALAAGLKPRVPRVGLIRCQKPKNGAQLVPISRPEIHAFQTRASLRGLANIGHGTKGFKDPDLKADMSTLSKAKHLQSFSTKWASAFDLYAAESTVLYVLTKTIGESHSDWVARAYEASKAGAEGIRKMLRDSLKPNVTVQQPMAFERVVDLLAGGLGPGIRRDMAKTLTHSMNTLPILPPQYEQALLRGEGLALPGGDVKEVFNCPHEMYWGHQLPDLEFFIQPGMGIGVRALRDIEVGEAIGPYAGEKVPAPVTAEKYITRASPSRYQVNIVGNVPLLKRLRENKLSCDAQLNASRNFEWARNHNVTGPFLNAADDDASANCRLDRAGAWIDSDTGLLCMLMICTKKILKGEFLMWKYDPRAGASTHWSFH